jgi:hypothetical protein
VTGAAGDAIRIAAVLGHELRNPLAAALTGVSVCAELTDATDPRRPLLERAQADLHRVADLLHGYLQLAGGRLPAARVDLVAVLRNVAGRKPCVRLGRGPRAAVVRGQPLLLERALENLVENSLRAGARRVSIALRTGATQATIDVQDDGPGVPEALRGRLFEPFVTGGGGSGLGLMLVRETVRHGGGDVTLVPSAAGAQFRLTLPLYAMAAPAQAAP